MSSGLTHIQTHTNRERYALKSSYKVMSHRYLVSAHASPLTHAPLKEKKERFSPLTFFVIISVLKAHYASCHIFKKVTLNPLRALCDAT